MAFKPGQAGGPGFQKGNSLAKENNNQAKKRIRKSKLRKTLDKLYALESTAMDNIKDSVEGREVDKERLASSKWVVTNIMAVSKAAVQDEAEMNGLRWQADALAREEEAESQDSTPATVFSLHVVENNLKDK